MLLNRSGTALGSTVNETAGDYISANDGPGVTMRTLSGVVVWSSVNGQFIT